MGSAIAMNQYLTKSEAPTLRYNNRTMFRGQGLRDLEAMPRDSVAELVQQSDLVFLSVCSI